ncbi:hypothetical protein FOA20_08790 [Peribacillus simplex]
MQEVQSEEPLAFDTYITELFSVGEKTFSFTFFKSYLGKSKFIGFGSLLCVSIFVDNKEGLLDHGRILYRNCGGRCVKRVDKKIMLKECALKII